MVRRPGCGHGAECLAPHLAPEPSAVPEGVSGNIVFVIRPRYVDNDTQTIVDDTLAKPRAALSRAALA
ncbi:MAG: hypothetical protein AAGF11_10730 [Myxococcota bacterium]